tara:strand:+ start:221 stop:631 length:411 start_codon:yes stop_codon:yes gene_type:complete
MNNYKNKYLKYRKKYLNLKRNLLNGGAEEQNVDVSAERRRAADALIIQLNMREDFKNWRKDNNLNGVFQLKIRMVRAIKYGLINPYVKLGCDGDKDLYESILNALIEIKDLRDDEIINENEPVQEQIMEILDNNEG